MKVDAEIKPFYKLTLGNQDTCRGHYYSEDDWDIVIYGETLQEIMEMAPALMVNSEIRISSHYLEVVPCVIYRNMFFEMTDESTQKSLIKYDYDTRDPLKVNANEVPEEIRDRMQLMLDTKPDVAKFVREIEKSAQYQQLVTEKKIREEEEKRADNEAMQTEQEKQDRKLYEQLKKKYETTD